MISHHLWQSYNFKALEHSCIEWHPNNSRHGLTKHMLTPYSNSSKILHMKNEFACCILTVLWCLLGFTVRSLGTSQLQLALKICWECLVWKHFNWSGRKVIRMKTWWDSMHTVLLFKVSVWNNWESLKCRTYISLWRPYCGWLLDSHEVWLHLYHCSSSGSHSDNKNTELQKGLLSIPL